jgi:phosphoribosyl 1,2-cyclic phosphodiesterase
VISLASIGSGSAGNAILIRANGTCILVDNGFTLRETRRRLATLSVDAEEIDAIVVTHEHGDHLSGVGPFARKYKTPVWMTHGTWRACRDKKLPDIHLFHAHQGFTIGDVSLEPFPMPHDAAESCQFVFRAGKHRVATLTDLGCTTRYMEEHLHGLDGLLIECNYDADMLRNGPYGEYLQARIRGSWGHLDNVQAAAFARKVDGPGLQKILLGHLSEKNNTPDAVTRTFNEHAPELAGKTAILAQDFASDWFCFD